VEGPFIAVSDHMKLLADFINRWVPGTFLPLGTEGFGISDTRTALRRHFEIDAESIVCATLDALRREGQVDAKVQLKAMQELGIGSDKLDPMSI
jgi:pyruvate dehydrogenase E1 component